MAKPELAGTSANKQKRVNKPLGPRAVFILIEPAEGVTAAQVKASIKGFTLDKDKVLEDVLSGAGKLDVLRILIPRSARKRGEPAPTTSQAAQ
jgi:hypothetical protein